MGWGIWGGGGNHLEFDRLVDCCLTLELGCAPEGTMKAKACESWSMAARGPPDAVDPLDDAPGTRRCPK